METDNFPMVLPGSWSQEAENLQLTVLCSTTHYYAYVAFNQNYNLVFFFLTNIIAIKYFLFPFYLAKFLKIFRFIVII